MTRTLALVSAFVALTLACSKSSPSTPSTPTPGASVTVSTYVGTLIVPGGGGLGGMLLLTKSSGSTFANRRLTPSWLTTLIDFVQPTLSAQSSSASGTLVTDAGPVVQLSGTFANNTFSLAGGGYSITATVAGTSVMGSGSAPGGVPAQVNAVPPPSGAPPSPSAEGTYRSQFRIDAPYNVRVVRTDTGAVMANCSVTMRIDGTMSIHLSREPSGYTGFMLVSWTERAEGTPSGFGCPPFTVNNFGPFGINYLGPLDSLVFASREVSTQGAFTTTRTQAFVGALTGTTVQGTYWKALHHQGTGSGSPPTNLTEGYQNSSTPMTLIK